MKNVLILMVVGLYLVACGFFIGVTDRAAMFDGVKWTDVGTLVVTSLGFIFGFYTYFQWLNNKRKEDSYLVAKRYIAAIDEIEENLHELRFHYDHICPTPGLMVEDKDVSIKRIEHLNIVWGNLYQARRNLYKSNRELSFWNVCLAKEAVEDYNYLNKSLDNISVISSVLNNQLFHFVSSRQNMDGVIREKQRFDELHDSVHKIIQHRVDCGFKSMFTFEI
ncbi:hypothetical protein [Pseudoalteromonas sp. JB197]|uniref:hypothetical protein n=1 Tax=Pseudoalteromonas sp. JB197 TaxID=1434839 RepID=UPI00097E769F|nr:hypothetical protein [Pseudoalteromonas sp. JB197]PCC09922.1 hypothetical protein CIK86_18730 [Pseudoalteromonas sp. JB197]SJN41300.1 hypothetical protein CZ797_10360 [Pseudoalteromonas sp. JB197]